MPPYSQSPYQMLSPKTGPVKITQRTLGVEYMIKPPIVDQAQKLNLDHKLDSSFEPSPSVNAKE
jgi:hypothetical protein